MERIPGEVMDKSLVYYYSKFDKKYYINGMLRWPTFKLAFSILNQKFGSSPVIVETGCTRVENDWGAGMSTIIFGDYCKTYGGTLETVDLSKDNMSFCISATSEYKDFIKYHVGDSVSFLKSYSGNPIDLLYLDSYDYPYGELLNIYGGKDNIDTAIKILDGLSEDEIVKRHGNIIADSQEHCVQELLAALPKMAGKHIILIDDNSLPGGGKSRTAKDILIDKGYICLLDIYQSLWVSPTLI